MNNFIEKNLLVLMVLIIIGVSFGGMVEIIPLMSQKVMTEPIKNLKPLSALELEGRDIYIREGCNVCHSQMIRPLRAEVERYGHYSVAGEAVYNHPFLWGSKRTGPDLARVGGLYSDEWHKLHLLDPRSVVPGSNMPSFEWLFKKKLDDRLIERKLAAFQALGVPYADEDIKNAKSLLQDETEATALIAYLQQLGTHLEVTN
ncbi:MAG: cytochrome-c oxidase, cbb3-type subunit II [Rhodobacterales bacterium]|jgi:cytochrome c oxidase cbb3-type subunit 2|nr:cytochrome-c oxidase, cbb3-type subunit II [Gammaproteobacteria bacterium]MBT5440440.1 cytochrome-c oxidase, cbb3-type subunit II [Candidatus Neomarinimicrobiota bacterium]MBT6894982.1 cytochrome-c oxidase, cbb3-type subunit II [Rhodobacterales bacterium]|tara:strand:+ start:4691 stop:5296 length:606 start_codon:yes stop_codon:yes gene_type:complete